MRFFQRTAQFFLRHPNPSRDIGACVVLAGLSGMWFERMRQEQFPDVKHIKKGFKTLVNGKDGIDNGLEILEDVPMPFSDSAIVYLASHRPKPITMYQKRIWSESTAALKDEDRGSVVVSIYNSMIAGTKNILAYFHPQQGLIFIMVVNRRKQKQQQEDVAALAKPQNITVTKPHGEVIVTHAQGFGNFYSPGDKESKAIGRRKNMDKAEEKVLQINDVAESYRQTKKPANFFRQGAPYQVTSDRIATGLREAKEETGQNLDKSNIEKIALICDQEGRAGQDGPSGLANTILTILKNIDLNATPEDSDEIAGTVLIRFNDIRITEDEKQAYVIMDDGTKCLIFGADFPGLVEAAKACRYHFPEKADSILIRSEFARMIRATEKPGTSTFIYNSPYPLVDLDQYVPSSSASSGPTF